jgi:hypothetical protein
MDDKKAIFSKEYVQESKTAIDGEQRTQEIVDVRPDSAKYGISKPSRIIIRGTVSYDKG